MAFVASVAVRSTDGSSAVTSTNIDTTGATLLVAALTRESAGEPTITDSYFNTWVPLTEQTFSIRHIRLFYVENPTVGAGHNFSVGALSNSFPTLGVLAFDTVNAFDLENGATDSNTSGTTIQPGAVLPSNAVSVVVTGLQQYHNFNSMSIDSSFVLEFNLPESFVADALGLAYKIKAAATSENPNWTWLSGAASEAVIASFIVGAGPATTDKITQMVIEAAEDGGPSFITQMVIEAVVADSVPVVPVDITGTTWGLHRFDIKFRGEERS